jgi:hypothetical protein
MKYIVMFEIRGTATVEVEASEKSEAENKARDLVEDGWSEVDFDHEIDELISLEPVNGDS